MFSHPALRFSVWSITAMLSLAFVGYAYSQSVPPSSSNGIKWHPGVYVNTGNYRCNPTQLADDYATIAEIGSMPNVNGIHIRTMWECLEGPTAGDYSAGFALIDEYLRRLEAAGNKRLILQLWPMGYGACTASNSSGGVYTGGIYLPAYIKNNPSMMDYCYSNQRLWSARLWQRDVMDRVIALSAAYAARYNNHPLFEMIELHEESVGMVGNTSAGFSWAAAEAQWNRMITAAKSHWTNTLVHDPVNFMQDDAMVRNQLTTHTAPGLIYGTTDTLIESVRIIPGQMAWRGLNSTGFDVPAWRDLRPGPWVSRVMWGPLYRTETPTQAHAYARDTMNASYLIWWRQTYHDGPGDGSTQWPALKTFINAGRSALTNTACPSGWTCNTTGTQPSPNPTPPSTPSGGTFSCTAPTDGGTLRLCDGFETGALNMSLWSFSGNERAQVTNTTARTGNGSVMFPLGPTDSVNYRDEIVSDNSGEFYIGGDYCIHASMKAENWSNIPDSWAAIFQTHAVPGDWSSGCIAARNSISLNVENETNTLGLKVIDSSRSYPPGSSGGALASFTAYSTPFVQGRWYDFTFRYKPSFGADGILEAWHDGQQVYSQTGGNVDSTDYCGQPASPFTYLKIGLYKDRRDTGDQTVYYDNVKITEGGTCGPESFGASPSPTPSTPPPRNISVGIPVTSVASVNVRENPSVTSPIVSTQAQDSMGQVIGGPVQADGYTWWQVSWSDGTTGWSAETYLYRLTISSPVGGVVSGNNWCSVSGIAGVSPGGMCSYSRNESLLFGISRTPGDVSATQNSVSYGGSSYGGNDVLGYCGNADTFGSGRVEVILKTSGTPGPGECVISPNVDYFVNVATNIDILPLSTPQTQDEYAILFTRLPGPTQGTAPTTPTYTILPPAVTPNPVPPPGAPIIPQSVAGIGPISPTPIPSGAGIYYVATNGNDNNPGSLALPWRTIGKANQTLVAGNTVVIREGVYAENIDPVNSGTAGAKITYMSYPGENILVTGSRTNTGYVGALNLGGDYITVDGVSIKQANPPVDYSYNVILNGDYNIVRNVRIINTADARAQYASAGANSIKEIGVGIGGRGNLVEHSLIENMSMVGVLFQGSSRLNVVRNSIIRNNNYDAVRFESSKGAIRGDLVENNLLHGSRASDGVQWNPDWDLVGTPAFGTDTSNCGAVVRNNIIFDNAENGIDLKGACHIVIDGNTIYGNRGDNNGDFFIEPGFTTSQDRWAGESIARGYGVTSRDNIIRRNFIYDNNGGINDEDPRWAIYHNTIVNNRGDYTGSNSTERGDEVPEFPGIASLANGSALKNNLIGEHGSNGIEVSVSASTGADIDGNVYFNRETGQPLFYTGGRPWSARSYTEWLNALLSSSSGAGKDIRSRTVSDPLFTNTPVRPTKTMGTLNARLRAGSPAIDVGVPLTTAVGGGNGTTLRVQNALYFFDGFGITSGDLIQVGNNTPVRVTAVNYGSNTLTLSGTISWSNGDGVSLPYNGSAPDVGAFENVATNSAGGIKWHPGHYILPFVNDRANFISYISQLSGEPNVEGIKIRLYWADLEGAEGDYRAGISLVRSYLDAAEAIGKRIILVIVPTKYGIGSTSGIVPSYLSSNPIYNGGIAVLDDRVTTRVWDPAVITRMIALADAYGAEFNTEPYFEGFEIGGETALGPVDGRVGYTNSSFDTQLRRLMTETREAFPNTNLFIHANFYKAGQALLPSLLQHAQSLDYVWAGPDILPDTGYPGNTTGNGPTDGDNALTGVLGGVDYRGNIAVGPDSQSPVYGGKDGSYLFSEIQTYSATLRANYIMWVRGIPSNLVTQFDRSDMTESAYESAVGLNALLNYIDTAPQTVQTCPRNMSCNTN